MARVVSGFDEFASEPPQQFGVRVFGAFPVPRLVDDAASHQSGPDTVGHDLSKAFVLRCGDECCESVTRVLRILRESICEGRVGELGEGPLGFDGGTGFEGDIDERFPSAFAEFLHRDAARGGNFDAFGVEHGREGEDLFLF